MTTPTLSQIRKRAEEHAATATNALVKAPLDDVLRLQERVTAFRHVISWLDAGAPAEIDDTDSTAETPGPRGAY